MNTTVNKIRASNFRKATELKKLGFASSIHALPPEVKSEVDRLLITGTSIREVLKIVSNQYPDIKFPSINAVSNYKNKYLGAEITTEDTKNLITLNKVETDVLVDKLKKSIADFYVYLADEILPKLADGLKEGLEKEKLIKMPMKVNSDRTIAIASLVREMNNFARGNGINVMAFEKTTTMTVAGQEQESYKPKESNYEKLARILTKRGFTITQNVRGFSETNNNSTPISQ